MGWWVGGLSEALGVLSSDTACVLTDPDRLDCRPPGLTPYPRYLLSPSPPIALSALEIE